MPVNSATTQSSSTIRELNITYIHCHVCKRCRAMAEAGADFIVCQHSHVVGTREGWHGSEILYGQGNSIFGYWGEPTWDRGLICIIDLIGNEDGVQSNVRYFPIVATLEGEVLATDDEAYEVLGAWGKHPKTSRTQSSYALSGRRELALKTLDSAIRKVARPDTKGMFGRPP